MLKMMAALSFRNSGTGICVLFPDTPATHPGQIACHSGTGASGRLPFHFETRGLHSETPRRATPLRGRSIRSNFAARLRALRSSQCSNEPPVQSTHHGLFRACANATSTAAASRDQRAPTRIARPSDPCVNLPPSRRQATPARNRARSWGRRIPAGRTLPPGDPPLLPTQLSVRRRASNAARDDRAIPITNASPPSPMSPATTSTNESPGILTPGHPTHPTPQTARCESAHRYPRSRSRSGHDQRDPVLASSDAGGQRELDQFSSVSVRVPLTLHRHEARLQ
jgi:hypothetical protein